MPPYQGFDSGLPRYSVVDTPEHDLSLRRPEAPHGGRVGQPRCSYGTVAERKVLVCHGSSGDIWAQIVLVNAGYQLHAVMIPAFGSADAVPTFLDFLSNDNERLQVSTAEHNAQTRPQTGTRFTEKVVPSRIVADKSVLLDDFGQPLVYNGPDERKRAR